MQGSFPGLGRFPGGGNVNPLQCSCRENPTDREAHGAHTAREAHAIKLKSNISRTSSGSQELKPTGMATVSTSLGRSGKSLPTATFSIREGVGLSSMQALAGSKPSADSRGMLPGQVLFLPCPAAQNHTAEPGVLGGAEDRTGLC